MWQNKMNRSVAACTGKIINACREFALAGVSEFPGCCNVDVKPLWWFSESGTERFGPSECHCAPAVSAQLYIRCRTQRCHLHSKTTCSWVSSASPTFLPPRDQWRTVSYNVVLLVVVNCVLLLSLLFPLYKITHWIPVPSSSSAVLSKVFRSRVSSFPMSWNNLLVYSPCLME